MENSKVNISCPNCGQPIDVDDILYHQMEEKSNKKYQAQLADIKKEFEDKELEIQKKSNELIDKEKSIQTTIDQKVNENITKKEIELKATIKKEYDTQNENRFKEIQTELNEKNEKLKELNTAKNEIEKLKREKSNLREEIELENQPRINELIETERVRISKNEAEKSELKISEKENIINQLKEQLTEAQRKAEQGSMQLQGEVQELGIEEWLKSNFPLDNINEIKKGQRGADSLQIINTYTSQNCGSIYYESKRTKDFQPAWIEKFRNDMREQNANIGVLVSDVLPKGFDRMGLLDGIWVCTYQEFKGLCFVLRENIIQISTAIISQENKGDKMVMLYDFLTSNEFRLQVEAIVEGFTQMQSDLITEKRSIQGHWKKREKQIQKVLLNTNFMYNSIKGIAGSAIQPIKQLELQQPEDNIETDEETI
jgi:hypothetical protein